MLAACVATGVRAESLLSIKPYTAVWSSPGFLPTGLTGFLLGDVLDDTGRTASFDIRGHLRDQLRQLLLKEGFSETQDRGSADSIRIDLSIRLFQEGGAFGRWLPGGVVGAAYCVAYVELRKGNRGQGAEVVMTSALTQGGLFSAGAEKTVLNDIAEEIVLLLKSGERR
jgi:hypothetical protein